MIDIQQKKTKILEFLESNGPSLPVQVARAIQMDPVFASAILSELLGSKQIKTSHMKVGASPLYLIPGQEEKLEEKTEHLKSIERESQEKLKSQKVIYDESEDPAIRVALRNIKDFATPFKFQDKITWRYAFTPQEEIDEILSPKEKEEPIPKTPIPEKEEPEVPKAWEVKKAEIKQAKEESAHSKEHIEQPKKIEKIFEKSKTPKTFLKEIEHFLKNQDTTITAIEEVDKNKVVAIVKSGETSSMLFAFNKIRIDETELLKCYKEAEKKDLPYQIIIKGSLAKKLTNTIRAHQKLIKINKLEN